MLPSHNVGDARLEAATIEPAISRATAAAAAAAVQVGTCYISVIFVIHTAQQTFATLAPFLCLFTFCHNLVGVCLLSPKRLGLAKQASSAQTV